VFTWAFITKLDGTPWATVGFTNPEPGEVRQWAFGVVVEDTNCSPDAVDLVGNLLTVDGLPCFKLLC
jgi:hypothetical protein